MIDIDGSLGEGGGQVLRTSLALSMVTGKPFAMRNVRANRRKPGLRRQHLACVEIARDICGATVRGAEVSSRYLEFAPGPIGGGTHHVDIGSMGAASLVVQTVAVPAIVSGRGLRVAIRGGTHNPMAPPFEFLDRVYLPYLRRMGATIEITLDRHGFLGEAQHDGGARGQLTLNIDAASKLRPIDVVDTPEIDKRRATALLARLPTHVGDREIGVVQARLGWSDAECEVRDIRDGGPGNALLIDLSRGEYPELISHIGEKGTRAELVAERTCDEVERYLAAGVPVGEHLADQLLLPMAIAHGGRYRCAPLTLHATTNIETIGKFLPLPIRVEPDGDAVIVSVG
jgi:RNA 3'-terminal phosphate cyclase (ATP)